MLYFSLFSTFIYIYTVQHILTFGQPPDRANITGEIANGTGTLKRKKARDSTVEKNAHPPGSEAWIFFFLVVNDKN